MLAGNVGLGADVNPVCTLLGATSRNAKGRAIFYAMAVPAS